MDGIVTILKEPYNRTVRDLWVRIQEVCKFVAPAHLPETPNPWLGFNNDEDLPHFSWHIAESYDRNRLSEVLKTICQETSPFTARTAGLGIFTIPKPVIYIVVVKDRPLLEFHEKLWQRVDGLGQGVSSYYTSGMWVPHITLAHENLDSTAMGCIIQELASLTFDWEMKVEDLAIASQAGSEGLRAHSQFHFKKE